MTEVQPTAKPDDQRVRSILQMVVAKDILPEVCARAAQESGQSHDGPQAMAADAGNHTVSAAKGLARGSALDRLFSRCEAAMGRGQSVRRYNADSLFWQSSRNENADPSGSNAIVD